MIREIFEAERWHTDSNYMAPMASINGQNVFVGDVVICRGVHEHDIIYAKVNKFTKMV